MERIKQACRKIVVFVRAAFAAVALGLIETFGSPRGRRLLAVGAMLGGVLLLVLRPPMQTVGAGEVGVRRNRLTGGVGVVSEGPTMVLPLLHDLRLYTLRDGRRRRAVPDRRGALGGRGRHRPLRH
jgi:hypothetical protein